MRQQERTSVKPLMVNFITPKAPEISEPSALFYDDQSGITYYMGGGGDEKKAASRCNDIDSRTSYEAQGGPRTDYERYTDD